MSIQLRRYVLDKTGTKAVQSHTAKMEAAKKSLKSVETEILTDKMAQLRQNVALCQLVAKTADASERAELETIMAEASSVLSRALNLVHV